MPLTKITPYDRFCIIALRNTSTMSNAELARRFGISTQHLRSILKEAGVPSLQPRAEDEMLQGYLDGLDLSSPLPSNNRSRSYRHGFANGRDDRAGSPRASAEWLRAAAEAAMEADEMDQ